MRRIVAFVIFAITLITLAVINIPYIAENANLGVEFNGGYEIVYEVASEEEGKELTSEEIDVLTVAASDVIITRLDIADVKNPIVDVEDGYNRSKQIRVTVGAVSYKEFTDVKELIETDVELSFRDVNNVDLVQYAISTNPSLGDGSDLLGRKGATVQYYNGSVGIVLDINNTELFNSITTYLSTRTESSLNKLVVWMNYEDGDNFDAEAQKENGKIIVAIDITSPINNPSPFIQGQFTPEYAQAVSNKLMAGSIDFKLVPSGFETKINASYGKDALAKSALAALVALISIAIVLIVVYGIPGFATVITLFAYAAACFGTLNVLNAEVGPDAISAIIIGAGLAVNTSIILFERIKDEILKGRNLKKAFEEGSKKTLSTILDSNLVALLVSLVLFFVGTRTVKTFSTMLFVCVVFSLIIMVLLLKVFLSFVFNSQLLAKRKYLFGVSVENIPNVKENEQQKYFGRFGKTNFVKNRKIFAIIPVFIAVLGLVVMAVYSFTTTPLNLGSHFAAGTRISITSELAEYDSVDEIKTLFASEEIDLVVDDVTLGKSTDEGIDYNVITVRFPGGQLSNDQISAIDAKLSELVEEAEFNSLVFSFEINNVSAIVAFKTLSNAAIALGIAALFVLGYVLVRFKLAIAIATITTLVLNITTVFAIFALVRLEVNYEFITAILAIAAFSAYDTVIVFDRLRENISEVDRTLVNKEVRLGLINKTLQQSFVRSIVSLAAVALIPVSLLVFGSSATSFLSLAILFGLVIGSYNSVFFAPMIWLFFDNRLSGFTNKTKKFKPKKASAEPEEVVFLGVND